MSTHPGPLTDPTELTDDERALHALLTRSTDALPVPLDRLREGARARGRRLRRRRRVTAAVAGLAAAGVAAVGIPALVGSGWHSPAPDGEVAPDATRSAPVASAPTTPQWWAMPASEMRDELERLLPRDVRLVDATVTNVDRAPGEPLHELEGALVATLDPAGDGLGKVNAVLIRPAGSDEQRPDRDGEGTTATVDSGEPSPTDHVRCSPEWLDEAALRGCRVIRDSRGRPVGQVVDHTSDGVRSYSLSLLTSDGGVVHFSQANTTDAKWPYGSTPTAEDLPLTPDELRRIAEDPTWTTWRG